MSEENVERRAPDDRVVQCAGQRGSSGPLDAITLKSVPLRAAMEGTAYRGPEAFAAFGADSDAIMGGGSVSTPKRSVTGESGW